MDSLAISIVIGSLLIVLSGFLPKRKFLIRKHQNSNNRDLTKSRDSAKKLTIALLAVAFLLVPLLMGFVMPRIEGSRIYNIVLSLAVLSILFCIAMSGICQRYSKIIESELSSRSTK